MNIIIIKSKSCHFCKSFSLFMKNESNTKNTVTISYIVALTVTFENLMQ